MIDRPTDTDTETDTDTDTGTDTDTDTDKDAHVPPAAICKVLTTCSSAPRFLAGRGSEGRAL